MGGEEDEFCLVYGKVGKVGGFGGRSCFGRDRFGMQVEFLVGLRGVSKWLVVKVMEWEFGQVVGRQ